VAALAVLAGAHLDESIHREDRVRGRTALRVVARGPQRPAPAGGSPAPALIALTSLDLDFGDVPTVLLAGEAMPDARAAVYARLIAEGALPALTPLPAETALEFLRRSATAIAPCDGFVVQFGEHEGYDMAVVAELGPDYLIVSFESDQERMLHCDLASFDAALQPLDAALAGALIHAIERNASALNAIGPAYAWDLARMNNYFDDFAMWWDEMRGEVEYLKREKAGTTKKKITVTNLEIRQHIREGGIRTPGALRNELGRHYCASPRMKPNELEARIAALPPGARCAALAIWEIAKRMKRASKTLQRLQTETERHVLCDISGWPHPALILDPGNATGGESVIYEVLDERYQLDAQDRGWGAGFALVLEDSKASVHRFTRAHAALRDLGQAARDLCEAMRGFDILATEAR
jgi:hypothetical protein